MPPKKGTKKQARRRRYKKKPKIPYGLPQSQVVRMRFADEITLDPVAGAISVQAFNALSIYAPKSSSSHQPMYYDTFSLLYDYYTVIGSKLRLTPVTTSASNQVPGYYGVILDKNSDATTGYLNMTDAFENVGSSGWKITIPIPTVAGPRGTVLKKYSPRKFFNISKTTKINSVEGLSSAFGASPSKQAWFTVYYGSPGAGTVNPSAMYFLVEMEFLVLLNGVKQQLRN